MVVISSKIKKDEEEGGVAGEWKYAAMVMDRFDDNDHADDHVDDHTDYHADDHANAEGERKYGAMMIIIPTIHMLTTFTRI